MAQSSTVKQPRCRGLLGLIKGHKFVARYSTQITAAPKPQFEGGVSYEFYLAVMDKMRTHSSIHTNDVCERCGLSIKPLIKPVS